MQCHFPDSWLPFIERKKKYKTRLYLTSGGKEYVPDGRPGHHSPFARKFLEALRNYGGNDGILTVNEIIQYVKNSGGIRYAIEQMTHYQQEALKILDNFKDSVYKKSLIDLVQFTIERTK